MVTHSIVLWENRSICWASTSYSVDKIAIASVAGLLVISSADILAELE